MEQIEELVTHLVSTSCNDLSLQPQSTREYVMYRPQGSLIATDCPACRHGGTRTALKDAHFPIVDRCRGRRYGDGDRLGNFFHP